MIEAFIRNCGFGSVEMGPRRDEIHLIATKGTPDPTGIFGTE